MSVPHRPQTQSFHRQRSPEQVEATWSCSAGRKGISRSAVSALMQQQGQSATDKVATVLQLVVQHAELDNLSVFRLLRVSSGVRTALQQGSGRMVLGPDTSPALNCLQRFTGLGAWLPSHCGLVSNLRVLGRNAAAQSLEPGWAAAAQVLTFALQLCSSRSATPGQSAAVGALQLKAFITDFVHSPAALRSLASCSSLVKLGLVWLPQQHLTSAFVDALGSLTNLTWLTLSPASASTALPAGCAAALGRLTKLRVLHITQFNVPTAGLPQLPDSLKEVWLQVQHAAGSRPDVALSHLRRLRVLKLFSKEGLSAASQLPTSLHRLTLIGPAEAVGGLQRLQWLELEQPQRALPLLARLSELSQLQGLKARLGDCEPDQLGAVVAAIAVARLTRLQLYSTDSCQDKDGEVVIDCRDQMLHRHLRQLRQLRMLHLSGLEFDAADAMHFTALSSSLTDLKLSGCRISDLAVAAMLQRLTGLQRLTLQDLGLTTPLLWVTLASLTNLQSLHCLWMDPDAGLSADTLHLLSALTSLTSLRVDALVDENDEPLITPAMRDEFMADMPLLREFRFEYE